MLQIITAEDVKYAVALSLALLDVGMRAVGITPRTDVALEAIAAARSALQDTAVAAGKVSRAFIFAPPVGVIRITFLTSWRCLTGCAAAVPGECRSNW